MFFSYFNQNFDRDLANSFVSGRIKATLHPEKIPGVFETFLFEDLSNL